MNHMNQCISMSVHKNGAMKGEKEGGERNLVENDSFKNTKRDKRRGHTRHINSA